MKGGKKKIEEKRITKARQSSDGIWDLMVEKNGK